MGPLFKRGSTSRYEPAIAYAIGPLASSSALLMIMSNQRLPRRFDTAMKSLRELSRSKSERTRLAAVLRMTDILLEHQRSLERVSIARERALARQTEARSQETPVDREQRERAEESETEQALKPAFDAIGKRVRGAAEHDPDNAA